jgi:aspartyl-tRNA(Asn)/glutamyl-tRNA(Gln) amidotransferase subunit C
MNISDETIEHIAHLSRLKFIGEEKNEIKADLEKIIGFMSKLNELNTDHIEPLIFMSSEINRLREDIPVVSITHEDALKNAQKKDSDYFRIPKVLEK